MEKDKRKKGTFLIHAKYFKAIKDFTDAKIGRLFRALHEYHESGKVPDFDSDLMMAFEFYRNAIDDDTEKYEAKCIKNQQNAYKRWKENEESK